MAYEIPGFSITLVAGADLSTSLFRGVTLDTNGKAVAPAAGAKVIGALANKPNSGEAATVVVTGVAQMEAGAPITLAAGGTAVKVDNTGKVIAQGGTGTAIGVALEAASASGVIIAVLLIPAAL